MWRAGSTLIAVHGLLNAAASLVADVGFRAVDSVVVKCGSGCPAACGIFPDQGSNSCPMLWQADS